MHLKQNFDSLVGGLLREAPMAPAKPATRPAPAPTKTPSPRPSPAPHNPDPFRRHKPGQMPEIAPKGAKKGSAIDLKQEIKGIIGKYSKFIKG